MSLKRPTPYICKYTHAYMFTYLCRELCQALRQGAQLLLVCLATRLVGSLQQSSDLQREGWQG